MDRFLEYLKYFQFFTNLDWAQIMAAFAMICGGLVILLNILIALFMLIPGEQPEKTLQAIVDWLKKYSSK